MALARLLWKFEHSMLSIRSKGLRQKLQQVQQAALKQRWPYAYE